MNTEHETNERPPTTPAVGSSALLGGITEQKSDSALGPQSNTHEHQQSRMPSQWTVSEWLHEIDQSECPVFLSALAKTSADKHLVEGLLLRWKESGRPTIPFLPGRSWIQDSYEYIDCRLTFQLSFRTDARLRIMAGESFLLSFSSRRIYTGTSVDHELCEGVTIRNGRTHP